MKTKPTQKQINDTLALYDETLGTNPNVEKYMSHTKKRKAKRAKQQAKSKQPKLFKAEEVFKRSEDDEQRYIVTYFNSTVRSYYPNVILDANPFAGTSLAPPEWIGLAKKNPQYREKIRKHDADTKNRAKRRGFEASLPDLKFTQIMIHDTAPIIAYNGSITFKKLEASQMFTGLAIELKKTGNTVYHFQTGEIKESNKEHHELQLEQLKKLRKQGYWADFVIGEKAAKQIIDWYFKMSEL